MIKVLFLINTLNGGGAEKVLLDTVNSLDHNKYKITVQTIFDEGIYKERLSPEINYKTIIKSSKRVIRRLYTRVLFSKVLCKLAYKVFIDDRYDCEIAFLEGLPTKIISRSSNKNCKKIAWVHTDMNAFPDSYKAYGSCKKESAAYKVYDKIFCVSEYVKKSIKEKYNIEDSKLGVLYNVIDDVDILQKSKIDVELPEQTGPLFISVGRLVKVKGYDRLLRVHKRLIDDGLNHMLIILGDGEERDSLETYIKNYDLQKSAYLLGYKENPYKYISKADLFICSSYAEGYSTVVSESVVCGVPVLSTDVSGAREPIVSPRSSIIVDNNEDAIYDSLRLLLEASHKLQVLKREITERQQVLMKDHLVKQFENQVFEFLN